MQKTIEKECQYHGLTIFSLKEKTRYRCRKCSVEAVQRRREKVKLMAVEHKGGCCIKCGYNKCMGALEFHHTDPTQKDFAISNNGTTKAWSKIIIELEKCILVCANCHREIHHELHTDV